MPNQANRKPTREFRAGTIIASVWETAPLTSGRNATKYDVRIQKRYRDERSGQWKSTSYFRPEDLPKLALVASKVFEELTLRIQDPADYAPANERRGTA